MKQLFLFISAVVLLFISSCESDQNVTYKFTDIDIVNINSSPGIPVISNTDSIPKAVFGLRLDLYPVETSRSGRTFNESESSVVNENPIRRITITCTGSFDSAHPAGVNITDKFIYFPGNYLHTQRLVDEYSFQPTAQYNDDYYKNHYPDHADLLLVKPPDSILSGKFYVTLLFQNGGAWTDSSSLVKLY